MVGSELVPFPLSVHSPRSWKGAASSHRGSSTRARDVGAGRGCGPRMWGPLEKLARALGRLSLLPLPFPRSRQVCTRVLREWSLNFFELSCKYYWFSNHLRGLVFLVLDPRGRVSNMWFESFMPQGGSPSPGYLSHLLCPILGLQVLT